MVRGSVILEKMFRVIPPGIFGILSVLVGVSGDIISASLFPGYNMTTNMISELGVGPGGIFFNIGVILSGIFAIPYMIHLGNIMLQEDKYKQSTKKVAIYGSILSSISLSLIGVFPAYKDNFTIFLIHGTIAAICYICAVAYLLIYGRMMTKDERFHNILGYFALIDAGLFIVVLLTWMPLIQWIANIGIIIWTSCIASFMYYKKI